MWKGSPRSLFAFGFVAALAVTAVPGKAVLAEDVIIATAEQDSVNHHVGRAICHLVNRHADDVRCEARPTTGSLSNLSNVRDGAVEIAIVLSDWQHYAVTGTGPAEFMDGNFEAIRSLFSVHAEPFTLVVKQGAGIAKLDDLKGKRVNIGNQGSKQRAAMDAVFALKGWEEDDFALVEALPADQGSLAFCHDRVQAMVYRVSHPDAAVQKAFDMCDATLATMAGSDVRKLIAKNPSYSPIAIPKGVYQGSGPVETFGVIATLVSSSDVSEDLIYRLVKPVFEHLDTLKKAHPALRFLEAPGMAKNGLAAPLHGGAKRYFQESGTM